MNKRIVYRFFTNVFILFVCSFLMVKPIRAQEIDEVGGQLWNDFKNAAKSPCGQRDKAIILGKKLVEKYRNDESNKDVIVVVNKRLAIIEEEDKNCKSENSLKNLFDEFNKAKSSTCGNRNKAIIIGKTILDLYSADQINQAVILYVQKQIPIIEAQDIICQRNTRYDESYKNKRWGEFFAVGNGIYLEEGNSPISLDVILSMVTVGHKLAAYEKDNTYNTETIFFAKKAIELIESGVKTEYRWGIYEPYESKQKALGWLNYIIGYISYFRLNETKKAIPYFYQATKYDMEFKNDAFIYQAVAIYHFNKETVTISSFTISDFVSRASKSSNQPSDDLNKTPIIKRIPDQNVTLYNHLVDLYKLRYNLAPNENTNGLVDYIQKLIERPLIDPSANVTTKKKTIK